MGTYASLDRKQKLSPSKAGKSKEKAGQRLTLRPSEWLQSEFKDLLAMAPKPAPVAGKAEYITLRSVRIAAREALWIEAEASSLLGGIGRGDEWTLTIYAEGSEEDRRYGFTPPTAGGDGLANLAPANGQAIAEAIGQPWIQSRSIIERTHTHPAGARGDAKYRTEEFSPINKKALRKGEIAGDRAVVLYDGNDLALVTPSGKYIVGSTKQNPLKGIDQQWWDANYPGWSYDQTLPKWLEHTADAGIARDENVQLQSGPSGTTDGSEWRPTRSDLPQLIWKRVEALANQRFPKAKRRARRLEWARKKFAKRSAKGVYG